jgi:prepilin-type N-terminal cleavage/methylation domain-containing protein
LKSPASEAGAFTLVELLVTVTILAIVSASSFAAFSAFSSRTESQAVTMAVSSAISKADRQVRDATVGSYEMDFSTGAEGWVFLTDAEGLTASGTLSSFDWSTGSGVLSLNASVSGQWIVRLASDSKVVQTAVFPGASTAFPFAFPVSRFDERSVSVWYQTDPKNRIAFSPFVSVNPATATNGRVTLASIRSGTSDYGALQIRNVLGKKDFSVSGPGVAPVSVGTVTLTFAKGAKTFDLELRK